jgi:hypothetical protein
MESVAKCNERAIHELLNAIIVTPIPLPETTDAFPDPANDTVTSSRKCWGEWQQRCSCCAWVPGDGVEGT